jgi:hypothetical protein
MGRVSRMGDDGFGGRYGNSVVEEKTGGMVRRYWIEVG